MYTEWINGPPLLPLNCAPVLFQEEDRHLTEPYCLDMRTEVQGDRQLVHSGTVLFLLCCQCLHV